MSSKRKFHIGDYVECGNRGSDVPFTKGIVVDVQCNEIRLSHAPGPFGEKTTNYWISVRPDGAKIEDIGAILNMYEDYARLIKSVTTILSEEEYEEVLACQAAMEKSS